MIVGNYRVGRVLAKGGMSTVYRGIYRPTGMPVAIKVLTAESAEDEVLVCRLLQEARIQNMLGREHPGIVTCYEPLVVEGRPALVLEFVPGRTVADVLEDGLVFAPEQAVDIAAQVLDALGFAHRQGVVHRDIKSENILVTTEGIARIADFGVARAEIGPRGTRITEARDIVGTVVYMAPEQLASPRSVDHRADLYGLGATLFEMLTGQLPFDGDEGYVLMKRIELEPAPDVRELCAEVPQALAAVIARALQKQPQQRYATAEDMRAALLNALPGEGPASLQAAVLRARAPRALAALSCEPSPPEPQAEVRPLGYIEDLSGTLAPGRVLLRRSGLRLGRNAQLCDIAVPDDGVAPEHALILALADGEVLLVDLAHGEATTRGEGQVVTRARLHPGDTFCLAGRWHFRYGR